MNFFISGEVGFFPDEASRAFSTIIIEIEKKMESFLTRNDYGNAVTLLGVIKRMLDAQKQAGKEIKERKLFRKGEADYRLFIDHAKFVAGNDRERKMMLVENVIAVVRKLGARVKSGFVADGLESDIRNEFDHVR
jgi:hypothetical protein